MFLNSPYQPTVPAFPFPVIPPGTDPFAEPQVVVCFNERWLKYVVTCLYQLVLQSTWQVSNQDELDLVQAQAMTLIALFIQGCNRPSPNALPGAEQGIDFMLRQNPDNPCELQSSVDGVTWCTWADLSKCQPAVTQPGGGTPQPTPGGGQNCYHAIMASKEQWLVPTVVNAGDQITFSNVQGAGADGGIDGLWYCPNGQTFFAGACIGVPGTKAADIANTIPHMRLIVNIGGTWYDAYDTGFTVPGGVVNSPITVQINDSNIADNSGSYQFDVCVTNNAATSWTHIFDFGVTDGGFTVTNTPGSNNGVYVPGSYWNSTCVLNAGSYNTGISIHKALASRTLTDIVATYDAAVGTGNVQNFVLYINGTEKKNDTPPVFGTNKTIDWHGSQVGATDISLMLNTDAWNDNTRCNTGYCHLKRLVVSGVGTDPF